jgi:hypothetical protein
MENSSKSPRKDKYKVQNWQAYNDSLKKRGKITISVVTFMEVHRGKKSVCW